jgi:hypothetical protein
MSFTDSEIAGLIKRGFTVNNGMAELTVGDLTIAVLSGHDKTMMMSMIIRVPNGMEIFCRVSPSEIMGDPPADATRGKAVR